MGLFAALTIKVRAALATASAVLLVLFGAYCWGGRAAKKAVEIKATSDENKRLRQTIEIAHENVIDINRKSDDAVHRELGTDWMRD